MMMRLLAALVFAGVLSTQMASAQTGPGVQQPPLKNDLLENLRGLWTLTGTVSGRPVHGGADADWVLDHLYLRLHQKEFEGPESVRYIGWDSYDQRFVVIRLDNLNPRGSETNGFGLQTGNQIQFTFDYPTVPFRETWTWDPQAKTWQFLSERKDRRTNAWSTVSNLTLRKFQGGRRGGPPPGALHQPPPQQP